MKKFFHCFLKIFISYSCPNFFPCCSPLLHPLHCSLNQSPPCCPLPWVLYRCSLTKPYPFFPSFFLCPFPSGHCQFVPYFHTSGSILLICLLCSYSSAYRRDHIVVGLFLTFYLFTFRERGRKKERETSMCGCLFSTPYWGPGSRHVPRLGIELETLWFTGQHSVHSATCIYT